MPLVVNHGYRRKYAVGGRGIFDTIANLVGRVLTSYTAKTLGSKAMSAASNAALKGVEKGASMAVDHVIRRVPRKKDPLPVPPTKRTSQQQVRLNNLISGGGIATIHDFVKRYR